MAIEDYFDPYDEDDEFEPSEVKTCNRCGKTGLEWYKPYNKWILLEGNKPHVCRQINVADAFDDLTA